MIREDGVLLDEWGNGKEELRFHGDRVIHWSTFPARDWYPTMAVGPEALRALLAAQPGVHGTREQGLREAAGIARAGADKLAEWMRTLPLHSDERKDKSLRAGERYQVADAIEAAIPGPTPGTPAELRVPCSHCGTPTPMPKFMRVWCSKACSDADSEGMWRAT